MLVSYISYYALSDYQIFIFLGEFLVDLFERCRNIQSVLLSGMPYVSWAQCKASANTWPELSISKLHIRGVNLDSDFGIMLHRMPKLTELEIDGHARNITAAALSWWATPIYELRNWLSCDVMMYLCVIHAAIKHVLMQSSKLYLMICFPNCHFV
jgi:hypothetical protein